MSDLKNNLTTVSHEIEQTENAEESRSACEGSPKAGSNDVNDTDNPVHSSTVSIAAEATYPAGYYGLPPEQIVELSQVASRIRDQSRSIVEFANRTAFEIGVLLNEYKPRFKHGEFVRWRREECKLKDSTSERCMNAARKLYDERELVLKLRPMELYKLAEASDASRKDIIGRLRSGALSEGSVLSALRSTQPGSGPASCNSRLVNNTDTAAFTSQTDAQKQEMSVPAEEDAASFIVGLAIECREELIIKLGLVKKPSLFFKKLCEKC